MIKKSTLFFLLLTFILTLTKSFSSSQNISPHDPLLKKSALKFYQKLNIKYLDLFKLNKKPIQTQPFFTNNLNNQKINLVSPNDWKILGNFPINFLKGVAVSAHQVEGNNKLNDWWEFETKCDGKFEITSLCLPKFIRNSNRAIDHYQKFLQFDLDKAKDLGSNTFRFSIEWSRIEPKENEWDYNEVKYYRKYLQELKKRGLTPVVTLWHFTLPNWIQSRKKRLNGWEDPNTITKFTQFSAFCAKNFGDLVDIWITENEPIGYIMAGNMAGYFPPGKILNWKATKTSILNLARAHNAAYDVIKSIDPSSQIGLVQNMNIFLPNNPLNPDDLNAQSKLSYFYHWQIIDAAYNGTLDTNWDGLPDERLGNGKRKLDFLGINYYGTFLASPHFAANKFFYWNKIFPELGFSPWTPNNDSKNVPHNSLGWEIYPQGLYEIIMLATNRYNNIPIMITENGLADKNDSNYKRVQYVISHLQMILKAIKDGANIKGYFYWSLIDNFEWREAFRKEARFGLYHIENGGKETTSDQDSLERSPSKSVQGIREIFTKNGITKEILNSYGSFDQISKD